MNFVRQNGFKPLAINQWNDDFHPSKWPLAVMKYAQSAINLGVS